MVAELEAVCGSFSTQVWQPEPAGELAAHKGNFSAWSMALPMNKISFCQPSGRKFWVATFLGLGALMGMPLELFCCSC